MATKQIKKHGERLKPVDYEIFTASILLDFFNEKRSSIGLSYDDLAQSICVNYSVLYGFLNNQSNFYLVHRVDYFIMESLRSELLPSVSELCSFVVERKDTAPQSPFFADKIAYLLNLNKKFNNQIISEFQFYELLRTRYDFDNIKTPTTVTEMLKFYP